jgi:stage II sporulation protein D
MNLRTILLILLLFALTFSTTNSYASEEGTPVGPLSYKTEVKIKLLPAGTSFSTTIYGEYEIVNLDDGTLVTYESAPKFSIIGGKVALTTDGKTVTSAKGFTINELMEGDGNYIDISKILTASGTASAKYRGSFEILPSQTVPLLINRLAMENYLKGVVPSEMPASWPMDALRAQAVAARSYAYTQTQFNPPGTYLEMTVASQVYGGMSKETARSNQAIKDTSELYAIYNNVPINAFFHSSSGGHTENSENVWSSKVPYIRAVVDTYDKHKDNKHYGWEAIGQAATISQKLKLSDNQILAGLKVAERGPSNAATKISASVYDKTTKTTTTLPLIPSLVATPDRLRSFFGVSLKSIKFNIYTDSEVKVRVADGTDKKTNSLLGYQLQNADGSTTYIEDLNLQVKTLSESATVATRPLTYRFKGDGWGHMLGMSQWGARGMAEAGFTYDQIIKHYYSGVEVKKLP